MMTGPAPWVQSLTVMALNGAAGLGAATEGCYSTSGCTSNSPTPSVSVVPTQTGSMVIGVGYDYSDYIPKSVSHNEKLDQQALDPIERATTWVEHLASPSVAGSPVTVDATASANDDWALVAFEITSSHGLGSGTSLAPFSTTPSVPTTTTPSTTTPSTTTPPATSPPATAPPVPVPPRSVAPSFAGTAHPTLGSSGASGALDVIYAGTAYSLGSGDGTIVPVEVWNGTSQTMSAVDISGPAMSGSTVVGSGDSQDVEPGELAPGQVAFGMVFYSQNLPSGVTFNLTASGSTDTSSFSTNVQVVQANYSVSGGLGGGGAVVGTVTNTSTSPISAPIAVDLYCFSSSGILLNVSEDFVSGDSSLAPGATGSYSVDIPTDASGNQMPCPTYLVGSSG